jgi:hypothetical protein
MQLFKIVLRQEKSGSWLKTAVEIIRDFKKPEKLKCPSYLPMGFIIFTQETGRRKYHL